MRRPAVYIALFFMGTIFLLDAFAGVKLYDEGMLPEWDGRTVTVSGTVLTYAEKAEDHIQMTVAVSSFTTGDGKTITVEDPEKLLVNIYGVQAGKTAAFQDVLPGREIAVTGKISLPEPHRNPGTFDYRRYLITGKIYAVMKGEPGSLETGTVKDRMRHLAADIRQNFLTELGEYTDGETAALAGAMLFGDRSGLDEDEYEKFRKNGTAHILAVSGLHIGAVYGAICLLWRGRKRWIFTAVTASFLIFYCFLADFSPSVVRAVIMIILHLAANLLYRRYDILTAAALTAVAVLLVCPMQIYNTGFQMSFLAVAVISFLTPLTGKGMAGKLAFMFLFQLVMLPYTAYTFNYVSASAFLINIPVIAIAGIMVPAGAAMMLITYLFQGPVCRVLGMLFYGCAGILTGINDAAYRPGTLSFDTVSPKLWMILLFYGAFFTAASELFLIMKIRKRWHEILCIAAVVAVISAGAGRLADDPFRDAELVFVDVGQGDCMHLRVREGNVLTGGERNYLFDGGGNVRYDLGKKVLKQYLLKNGVSRVNGAFVTHLHTDHYKGICELARQGMIDRLFVYDGNRIREKEICKETGLDAGRITYLSAGQTVKAGEKAQIRVLWPLKKTEAEYTDMAADKEDENASSLIMQVTVDGVSVLVTGDLGEEGEEQLLAAGIVPDSDILKVGHHGSKTSSTDSFLDRVSPVMAVIQVGKNNTYGHPSPETLKRMEERKIPILRTDLDGAVMVDAEDGRITDVRTVIRRAQ